MSLKLCSFASGSSGNCIFIASDKTKLIIDIGISLSRVERSLKVLGHSSEDVSVLVTHTHSDHVSGLNNFTKKYKTNVYTHITSAAETTLNTNMNSKIKDFSLKEFVVGDIAVIPFKVSHDVPCVGYQIYNGNKKISVLTDLGTIDNSIIDSIKDSDLVFIECNHDETMLDLNTRYSAWLKRRIVSDNGHLSNRVCANACVELAKNNVKQIILGHLSKDNNYPELAFNTVANKLAENGIFESKDIKIDVAVADKLSGLFEIV